MPRPNNVFKAASNQLLRDIGDRKVGDLLPNDNKIAKTLDVSRTTISTVMAYLAERKIIDASSPKKSIRRLPRPNDYFDEAQIQTRLEKIEHAFMQRVLMGDLRPGEHFSEKELARETETSTASVREFLIRFSRFGLIRQRSRGGWMLCAFDLAFAEELYAMRRMLEIGAINRLADRPNDSNLWKEVERLIASHRELLGDIGKRFMEFPALDHDFHRLLIEQTSNRFVKEFYEIVSFVFHYHYQWDKSDEKERNQVALTEHLAILSAISERDFATAKKCLERHLNTARLTLVKSMISAKVGSSWNLPERAR
jgi:DNA-binding GntR family transcriptional regulator